MNDDDTTAALEAAAALASGWPTLHVLRANEAAIGAAQRCAEGVLGPLPQADTIAPWDEADASEPWELRVDVPGMAPEAWLALSEVLEGARLRPGLRPGARAADDLGLRIPDVLAAGGVRATLWVDAAEGGTLRPDLSIGRGVDAAFAEVERELCAAIATATGSGCTSDRGSDTASPVVHRSTGRFGALLCLPPSAFAGLDGDEVLALRRAAVAAVGAVVRSRAGHPLLRIAPDLVWSAPLGGMDLVVWFVAPAAVGLPREAPLPPGHTPEPSCLEALWRDAALAVEELELQIVPQAPAVHLAAVERAVPALQGLGAAVRGGAPRWIEGPHGLAFAPVWRIWPALCGWGDVVAALELLSSAPEIAAARVVPGAPLEWSEPWALADGCWHWVGAHCFCRLADGLRDRDVLPAAEASAPGPRAHALVTDLEGRWPADAPRLLPGWRAVELPSGAEAVELRLGPSSLSAGPLYRALAALGHSGVGAAAWLAHRGDHTAVRLVLRPDGAG